MPIIRAKDANGTWMPVATGMVYGGATSTAGLYIDVIEPITLSDGTAAFDLIKYENCNRFIIIYSAKDTTLPNGNFYKYAYDTANVDEALKILDDNDVDNYGYGINRLVTGNGETGVPRGIFDTKSTAGTSFGGSVSKYPDADIADYIFTQKNHIFGEEAIVIYAM